MKFPLFFLTIITLSLLTACKKQSCIHGTILDAKTGQPVPDAAVILELQYSGSNGTLTSYLHADHTGNFLYSSDGKTKDGIFIKGVARSGYRSTDAAEIQEGDCREATIRMEPLEGRLVLTLTNESGTTDPVYIQLINQCQTLDGLFDGISSTDPYPLLLQPGETKIDTLPFCLGDSTSIRWKFSENAPWSGTDSFFTETADPVSYQIKY